MKNQPPFNEFDVKTVIVEKSPQDIKCKQQRFHYAGHGWRTFFLCDRDDILKDAAKKGYDRIVIVKHNPPRGSASAGFVITMHTRNNVNTFIHEFLHTLGFSDEYRCHDSRSYSRNIATIYNFLDRYESDQMARNRHKDEISWYKHINQSTPIIAPDKTLGTPLSAGNNTRGLFPQKKCGLIRGKPYAWKPTKTMSIMESIGYNISAFDYAPFIRDAMVSLGIPHDKKKAKENDAQRDPASSSVTGSGASAATGSGASAATGTGAKPAATGAKPAATGTGAKPAVTGTGAKPAATGTGAKPAATGTEAKPAATGTGAKPAVTGASAATGPGVSAASGSDDKNNNEEIYKNLNSINIQSPDFAKTLLIGGLTARMIPNDCSPITPDSKIARAAGVSYLGVEVWFAHKAKALLEKLKEKYQILVNKESTSMQVAGLQVMKEYYEALVKMAASKKVFQEAIAASFNLAAAIAIFSPSKVLDENPEVLELSEKEKQLERETSKIQAEIKKLQKHIVKLYVQAWELKRQGQAAQRQAREISLKAQKLYNKLLVIYKKSQELSKELSKISKTKDEKIKETSKMTCLKLTAFGNNHAARISFLEKMSIDGNGAKAVLTMMKPMKELILKYIGQRDTRALMWNAFSKEMLASSQYNDRLEKDMKSNIRNIENTINKYHSIEKDSREVATSQSFAEKTPASTCLTKKRQGKCWRLPASMDSREHKLFYQKYKSYPYTLALKVMQIGVLINDSLIKKKPLRGIKRAQFLIRRKTWINNVFRGFTNSYLGKLEKTPSGKKKVAEFKRLRKSLPQEISKMDLVLTK